ncbi:hypothetical protein DH2020_023412 [Rehmannia glutinosa]|uniref:Retrotransposon Copia-like N-terminal domain-containing protein n=1 Tax=Rehmannia glutinosa TaxID=99300 RepID=A0ABR0W7S7_REHGL
MSTDSSKSSTSISSSTPQIISPHSQLVTVKLDDSNYLVWKQQVLTAIKGYGLEDFISEQSNVPEKFTKETTEKPSTLNPDFVTWQRQDQLLASWILSSLSEGILVLMVGLNTSKDIWNALETNFSSQSLARIMQYKMQLQTMRKGSLSMREYISKLKICFDALAASGQRLTEREQIMHMIGGLGPEYNVVMVSVTSRIEPWTVIDIQALLLSYEARLDSMNGLGITMNSDGSQPSLNTVTQSQGRGSFRGRSSQNSYQRGGRNGRGYRGRGGRFQANKIICQVCGISGHGADRCWHRFDNNYNGSNSGQAQARASGQNNLAVNEQSVRQTTREQA